MLFVGLCMSKSTRAQSMIKDKLNSSMPCPTNNSLALKVTDVSQTIIINDLI